MADRVVLHLDMDAFYASVEQRDDPSLQGRPVIVGADPQGGQGRGVVATASYEARRHGIHSAMPISRAWKLCPEPDGVYLRPRMGVYARVSRGIFALLESSVDVFEPASIDEAYAEVTERCHGSFEEAERLAEALQKRLATEFHLTMSVGVAPNKLVAKIATDLEKPRGLTVVPPQRVREVLDPLPVRVIPGVGPKTAAALAELGIERVGQLAQADPEAMAERFGVWGPEMVRHARGEDDRPVDPTWERKSVGSETTFPQDLPPDEAAGALGGVVEEALGRLRREGDQARTVTVKVRLADFETFTRSRTLPVATDDGAVLEGTAAELLAEAAVTDPVRLLGVRFSGLLKEGPRQTNLSDWPADVLGEAPRRRPPQRRLTEAWDGGERR